MNKVKNSVTKFFDSDSRDYLEYKYNKSNNSFMSLRKYKAINLLRKHLAPHFTEEFRILDAGCGPGILLDFFDGYGIDYIGFDISIEMLRLAKERAGMSSLLAQRRFIRGDVEKLPFRSNSFDAVVSLGVIEYLKEDSGLLAEISRITKSEGYVLIAVTNSYSYNLIFEGLIEYLRKKKLAAMMLNSLKLRLKRGQFKQMDFTIRRHSPKRFINELEYYNFKVVDSAFWGLNVLPYPLNYLCGDKANNLINALYDKVNNKIIRALGEGYLLLCQNNKR